VARIDIFARASIDRSELPSGPAEFQAVADDAEGYVVDVADYSGVGEFLRTFALAPGFVLAHELLTLLVVVPYHLVVERSILPPWSLAVAEAIDEPDAAVFGRTPASLLLQRSPLWIVPGWLLLVPVALFQPVAVGVSVAATLLSFGVRGTERPRSLRVQTAVIAVLSAGTWLALLLLSGALASLAVIFGLVVLSAAVRYPAADPPYYEELFDRAAALEAERGVSSFCLVSERPARHLRENADAAGFTVGTVYEDRESGAPVELPAQQTVEHPTPGDVDPDRLHETGDEVEIYLFDGPLAAHLEDGERPQHLFEHPSKGIRILHPDGKQETPHHRAKFSGDDGRRYLLVTDRRLLYVAGQPDGDVVWSFPYDDLTDAWPKTDVASPALFFEDESDVRYKFVPTQTVDAAAVSDAAADAGDGIDAIDSTHAADQQAETPSQAPPAGGGSPARRPRSGPGTVDRDRLRTTGGILRTFLYDDPLAAYLDADEQPQYLFSHDSAGIKITHADGTVVRPHTSPWYGIDWGRRFLLVTDRRLLYVAGQRDGDAVWSFSYDELTDARSDLGAASLALYFEVDGRTEYKFATNCYKDVDSRKGKDAVAYVRRRMDTTGAGPAREGTAQPGPSPGSVPSRTDGY
jgi:hypothetical protein